MAAGNASPVMAVRGRRVHLGALDLPLPPRAWLEEVPGGGDGLVVYRSRG